MSKVRLYTHGRWSPPPSTRASQGFPGVTIYYIIYTIYYITYTIYYIIYTIYYTILFYTIRYYTILYYQVAPPLGNWCFLAPFVLCALCSFVLAPLSASVASFVQLFEKVQWNIPRQVNLSCRNISIYVYVYIYIYRLYINIHVLYIYI